MNKILVRYGEIYLKGHNRGTFERQLQENIRTALSEYHYELTFISGRYLIENYPDAEERRIFEKLTKLCGVYSVSVAQAIPNEFETILKTAFAISPDSGTFKVICKRADKRYFKNSMEIAGETGKYILDRKPQLKVDLFQPQTEINIEVREDGKAYVFSDIVRGCGGLPVGSSGKGLLMLSGGIDSPVAGYMMAKRGMRISGLHFYSYPYTSLQAKEKVVALAKILKEYTLSFKLHVVPFTDIQDAIHEKCPEDMMVILMRRFMMRIANAVCKKRKMQAIVTGENLGQVASQTIQSISVTNELAAVPVLRPVIGFDKTEIIDIARQIGTYETSILPYEDCCTVFLPKHPVIKPRLERILEAETVLDVDMLVKQAVSEIETVVL